ncbi:hypothetical protein LGL55_13465 [Clostridium tagluense]|uniref:hypothetical protein n=1 Tax=Clostridium tagluense TaxID=360422 RepID=UPI001C0BE20A|nr:hypothetical protein [Clostridium tagluense]MBU3127237.1 hypothetical protein [Clostridium tagluense]MCB2312288.1 hypothetical protein [Clostridium tagluense]MCB2316974.1 hypothetical protein [Clostridium tagluense]MCB2321827.1 hypothetical protein [Clostridium tagluense]MCB2326753.1 hypothetical protein [Clostridium tagluense]
MINMDEYYNKIIDVKTEIKIKKTIKLNMCVNVIYTIVLFITIVLMVFGFIQIINKNDPTFYSIGLVGIIIDIIVLLYANAREPLKGHNANDKVYVYMRFLRNEIVNISLSKKNSLNQSLKINILIIRVNRQLHIIEDNIKNAFIFQTIDYNEKVNLIGRIISILREKAINLVEEKKTEKLRLLIDSIISLYGYTIFNELINDDRWKKILSDRDCKIKEVENLIDELEKIEVDEVNSNILNKIFKFVTNPYFLGCLIVVTGIIVYALKDVYTELFQIVIFLGVIMTFICAVFQFSPKKNKTD